jgi:hypothetical protein
MNRRMRGPHVRWCGRGRGDPALYPIDPPVPNALGPRPFTQPPAPEPTPTPDLPPPPPPGAGSSNGAGCDAACFSAARLAALRMLRESGSGSAVALQWASEHPDLDPTGIGFLLNLALYRIELGHGIDITDPTAIGLALRVAGSGPVGMIGRGGTQVTSRTLMQNENYRIDVENPAPGCGRANYIFGTVRATSTSTTSPRISSRDSPSLWQSRSPKIRRSRVQLLQDCGIWGCSS